jgi:hypothetical protein
VTIPRVPLRIEAYDPDAKDGDGDGIVQDGTAWERPVATRILDELGREIARGHTSAFRPKNLRYVDKHGKDVNYTPKHASPEPPSTTSRTALERLGHSSLGRRSPSIGSKRPGLSDLGHASIIDRHDPPKPPSPGKIPKITESTSSRKKVTAAFSGEDGALEILRQHWAELVGLEQNIAAMDGPNTFLKGEGDKVAERLAQIQGGFDGLPVPITSEQARALDAAGAERIFRVIDDPAFVEALRTGQHRAGTGMWGSGIYTSPDVDWIQDFSVVKIPTGKDIGKNYTMFYLDPNARVIEVSELRALQRQLSAELIDGVPELAAIKAKYADRKPRTPEEQAEFRKYLVASQMINNYGRLAALLGYDAIDVQHDPSAPTRLKRGLARGNEVVVINRTALRLPPQPSDLEWRELGRIAHGPRLAERTARLGISPGATHIPEFATPEQVDELILKNGLAFVDLINPDLTANEAFFGQPDEALRAIVHMQGFDAPPVPVTKAEVAALEEARAPVVYRALDEVEHVRDLREGYYWPGTGVHGAGIYVAPDADVVGDYTTVELDSHPNPGKHWTKFYLDPNARVITLEQVRAEAERLRAQHAPRLTLMQERREQFRSVREPDVPASDLVDPTKLFDDYGRVAALLGYDAILVEGDNPEYVVLNRSALRLPPQPSRAEWRRIGKEARAAANAGVDSANN